MRIQVHPRDHRTFQRVLALSGWFVLVAAGPVQAVQPLTGAQITFQTLTNAAGDYTASGAPGPGDFPETTDYRHQFTQGSLNHMRLEAFDIGTNTYFFRQLAERIHFARVDNANVTGAHQIVLYEQEAAVSGTNILLRPERVSTMEETLLSRVINRGADNVFANDGDGNGNNNNIERIDYIFFDGVPARDNLDLRGFMIEDRGGNDALQVAAITNINAQGDATGWGAPVSITASDWGEPGIDIDTIVYRGYDTLRPSADVGSQPIAGAFVTWQELGIVTGQLIYGYSLVANDVPAGADWGAPATFPLDTSTGSGGGGLDLMSGGAMLFHETLIAEVGDFVWNDLNGDGLQDPNEPGLTNVFVQLYDPQTNLAGQTRSASNGYYAISALAPDDYNVKAYAPSGYLFSPPNVGPDDALDSDIVMTNTGESGFFLLSTNESRLFMDIGLHLPATDLTIDKTASTNRVNPGEEAVFTITVTNRGPEPAFSTEVTDLVPPAFSISGSGVTTGSYNAGTGLWSIPAIPASGAATLTITSTPVAGSGGQTVTNTAGISLMDRPDLDYSDNTNSTSLYIPSAGLSLTKTADQSSVAELDPVTFTITVSNAGPDPATGVQISDSLPAGLTFSSATPSLGSYNSGSGVWTVGTVSVSSTVTLDLQATVDAGTVGDVITNTASVLTLDQVDPVNTNDSDSAAVSISGIRATKTSDVTGVVSPGDVITYSIAVTNIGSSAQTGIDVVDPVPTGTTYVADTALYTGPLIGGGIASYADDFSSVSWTNSTGGLDWSGDAWQESGDDGDPATGNVRVESGELYIRTGDTITRDVDLSNALAAEWTFVSRAEGSMEDTDHLQFEVSTNGTTWTRLFGQTNNFGGPVTNTVDLGNHLEGSTSIRIVNDDTVGGAEVYYVDDMEIRVALTDTGSVLDTFGTVAYTNQDGSYNWDTDWNEIGDGGDPSAGQVMVATGRLRFITADLNDAVERQVDLSDKVNPVLAYDWEASSLEEEMTVRIAAAPSGPFTDINTHSGTGSGSETYDLSSVASTQTTIRFENLYGDWNWPDDEMFFDNVEVRWDGVYAVVQDTFSAAAYTNQDGNTAWRDDWTEVSDDGSASGGQVQVAGSRIRFQQAGAGDAVARSANLSGALEPTLSFDWEVSGLEESVAVRVGPTASGPWTDLDSFSGQGASGSESYSLSSVASTQTTIRFENPGGDWTASDDQAFFDNVRVQWLESSGGAGTSTTTDAGDPPNLVSNVTLQAGQGFTVTFQALVDDVLQVTQIVNTASITSDAQTEPVPAIERDPVATADLGLSKGVDDPSPNEGDTITFTVTVTNRGPGSATGLSITDLLPTGLVYSTSTATPGSYDSASGVWTVGTLSVTSTGVLEVSATVQTNTAGTAITNTASITTVGEADETPADNQDQAVVQIEGADLQVGKSVDIANPLETIDVTWTVTVTNAGPSAASGVVVTDAVPAGVAFQAASTSVGVYDDGIGEWSIGALGAGTSAVMTLTARVQSNTVGTVITNIAEASASGPVDPDPGNNRASSTIQPSDPSLSILKLSDKGGVVGVGQAITYNVFVTNTSATVQHDVNIQDPIPAGASYVASSSEVLAPRQIQHNFLDTFSHLFYSFNDGTNEFSGDWEEDEANGATSGDLEIRFDPARLATYTFQLEGGSHWLRREADLAAYTNAVLRFIYRRDGLDAGEYVTAEVSSSGTGGPWTEVYRIEGAGTDSAYQSVSTNITPHIASNTVIRFASNSGMGSGDIVWIDDVEIVAQARLVEARDGNIPPTMADNIILGPGESLRLSFQATVDSPPGVTAITNIATVDSLELAIPQSDIVIDILITDLSLANNADMGIAFEREPIAFSIDLANVGLVDATGIEIEEVLPEELEFIMADPSVGSFDDQTMIWTPGNLAKEQSAVLTVYARPAKLTAGKVVTNTVTVKSLNQVDQVTSNNTAKTEVSVAAIRITNAFFSSVSGLVRIYPDLVTNKVYDLLYVDARSYHDNLHDQWALADRGPLNSLVDTGGVGRVPPQELPNHLLRFYRLSAPGLWQEEGARHASREVFAMGAPDLHPGQNWIRLWGRPWPNTIPAVLPNTLPAGVSVADSTRISWYNREATPLVTQEVYLAQGPTNAWVFSLPPAKAGQPADTEPLPLANAFNVQLPTNAQPHKIPILLPLETNRLAQTFTAGQAYSLFSANIPETLHPSELHLIEGGFTGGFIPPLSDRIWKLDRSGQRVQETIWYRTTDGTWRFTSPNYPLVPDNYFTPNDGIVIQTIRSQNPVTWTNRMHYQAPDRYMETN